MHMPTCSGLTRLPDVDSNVKGLVCFRSSAILRNCLHQQLEWRLLLGWMDVIPQAGLKRKQHTCLSLQTTSCKPDAWLRFECRRAHRVGESVTSQRQGTQSRDYSTYRKDLRNLSEVMPLNLVPPPDRSSLPSRTSGRS